MQESNRQIAMKVIESSHADLSQYAQDSYGMFGRGVTLLSMPAVPPGPTVLLAGQRAYHTLTDLRPLLAGLPSEAESDVLIRMIETYDPTRQAVVMIGIGSDAPISLKMRLDHPFIDP